jgi:hypothetical protein
VPLRLVELALRDQVVRVHRRVHVDAGQDRGATGPRGTTVARGTTVPRTRSAALLQALDGGQDDAVALEQLYLNHQVVG